MTRHRFRVRAYRRVRRISSVDFPANIGPMMSSSRPHGGASQEVKRTPREGLDEKDPDLGIL